MEQRKPLTCDDRCEACTFEVSTHECGHGLLCDDCYRDIHGAVDAECELS
jgi:hypothetical protein